MNLLENASDNLYCNDACDSAKQRLPAGIVRICALIWFLTGSLMPVSSTKKDVLLQSETIPNINRRLHTMKAAVRFIFYTMATHPA